MFLLSHLKDKERFTGSVCFGFAAQLAEEASARAASLPLFPDQRGSTPPPSPSFKAVIWVQHWAGISLPPPSPSPVS